jgi:hypothetical protein
MAVNFPLNPVDEQRYPDLAAGEPALDNGRVYVYDAAKGIWNLDTSEGSGEFLLKHGHDVDDAPGDVNYKWNKEVYFKSDSGLNLEAKNDLFIKTTGHWWGYCDDITFNADNTFWVQTDELLLKSKTGNFKYISADKNEIITDIEVNDDSVDKSLTTKLYVDNRDHILQQEIIKVQEEINALAPSTDRGIWKDAATQIPPEGHFSMRVSGGGVTADYTNPAISLLVIHRTDTGDGYHSFENDEIGDQIQLFDVEDQNYGLFEITGKDDQSNADYVSFDVKHLGGLGETHPEDDVIIRLFKPPSGGTASEFVKKLGDDMEGPLVFKEGGIIDGRTAQSMPATPGDPSNPGYRAGLELRTTADKPVAISADGSYKSVLDIYRYDTNQPNNRGKTLSMYANGNVITPGYFQTSEYVETPIVQSKNTDDLQLKRGSDIKLEIKSNIVEVNSELQVNQGIKLVSDGSDSGRTILYHKDSDLSVYQNRITFNKRGSASDTSNSGGGALWFRRDSLATTTLTWGKAGLTLTNYADQKFNVNQVRVYNVPDPVDEQDATNKRYVDLLSAKIEELEAKIANLDGSGSSQMSNSYRIFSQYTNSSDESIYTNYFGTNSPAMYEVNTFTINQRNLIIKSGGKLTVTKASPGTRSSVFHYDIIDVQLKTNISSNSSSYQEYWYLTVVPCGLEGGFADYSNFQYDTSYYLTFSEGSVGGSRLKNNEIELVGLGRPVESEDEVVEYAMTRLDRDGNLSNIYNYIYGHFVPDSYIKSATGLEILSIDNATAYIESNSANFERATINGIPGYKIWQGSSRNNFFTRTRIMNSIHRIAQ